MHNSEKRGCDYEYTLLFLLLLVHCLWIEWLEDQQPTQSRSVETTVSLFPSIRPALSHTLKGCDIVPIRQALALVFAALQYLGRGEGRGYIPLLNVFKFFKKSRLVASLYYVGCVLSILHQTLGGGANDNKNSLRLS